MNTDVGLEGLEGIEERLEKERTKKLKGVKPKQLRALYIGKFQPFHNGHLKCIKRILSTDGISELIVAIGSAQESWTLKNPFTAGERYQMIRSSLIEANLWEHCYLIPVTDIPSNHLWVNHLRGILPPWDIVYSNNTLSRALFKKDGSIVENVEEDFRQEVSSSGVRKLLASEKLNQWAKLVPKAVFSFILDHNLEARICAIKKEE